ncbi:MAG TPA: PEP-CTERM sorting domain-containing protein, partial [Novosphingobium sp.]|nr:PEP-CTERM sorting domain-containing protein [Novosphingobium sp.]
MTRKIALLAALAMGTMATTPAHATWWTLTHKHYCHCGHSQGGSLCGTTSGGSTTTGGTTTTTGGTTTSGG